MAFAFRWVLPQKLMQPLGRQLRPDHDLIVGGAPAYGGFGKLVQHSRLLVFRHRESAVPKDIQNPPGLVEAVGIPEAVLRPVLIGKRQAMWPLRKQVISKAEILTM